MQTLGLDAEEFAAFTAALASGANVSGVRVTLETLNEEHVDTVSHKVLPGSQVTVDSGQDVTRLLELHLDDPGRTLGLDSGDPNEGALYLDRMVRVHHLVRVPALGIVAETPVFLGPVVGLQRADAVVSLTAHGKEELAMSPVWRSLDLPKNTLKTTAVRRILRDRYGETRFNIPDATAKLPKARSLGTWDVGWTHAQSIADSMSRQLFYDGAGVAVMRPRPGSSQLAFTFTSAHIVGDVSVTFEGEFRNTIRVVGKGKNSKHTAHAPASHPLSAQNLGRTAPDGTVVPRYLAEKIDDDAVGSKKAARERAEELLSERLASQVNVTFNTVPIPHLDAGDWVAVETSGDKAWRHEFRLSQFTIPLSTDGDPTSAVGYTKAAPTTPRSSR